MADAELPALTATTTLDDTDILYVVKDPGGAGEADRKITGANVKASVVTQTITDGVTSTAPSEDAVFDALAGKQPLDADLTALAAAGNSAILAGTTAQFTTTAALTLAAAAPAASPALTGNPTAPTQTAGNNSTRIATTAYADALVSDTAYNASSWDAVTGIAPSKNAVRDQMELKAPLASPALTGNPTAPTQTAGNNSTRIATTAYVDTLGALKANLASPTFTGTPAAPTAAAGTSTTQVATTAFVAGEIALMHTSLYNQAV